MYTMQVQQPNRPRRVLQANIKVPLEIQVVRHAPRALLDRSQVRLVLRFALRASLGHINLL